MPITKPVTQADAAEITTAMTPPEGMDEAMEAGTQPGIILVTATPITTPPAIFSKSLGLDLPKIAGLRR